MMAKIVQGGCFRDMVNYVLDKKEAHRLATKGLRTADENSLISSFITQSKINHIGKPVAHISLDFSAQDKEKLTNRKMLEIAQEYMAKNLLFSSRRQSADVIIFTYPFRAQIFGGIR